MASKRRIEKLSMLLKEVLSKTINSELEFPLDTLITLTKVWISPDKHYATVFFSVLGKGAETAMEILQKNAYNIQQLLNRKLRIRPVPKINFEVDREEFNREKVEKSLAKLKEEGNI